MTSWSGLNNGGKTAKLWCSVCGELKPKKHVTLVKRPSVSGHSSWIYVCAPEVACDRY